MDLCIKEDIVFMKNVSTKHVKTIKPLVVSTDGSFRPVVRPAAITAHVATKLPGKGTCQNTLPAAFTFLGSGHISEK